MRLAKSKHPVGATWRAEDGKRIAEIRLDERMDGGLEVWRWCCYYVDGSGWRGDWHPTYRGCQQECGYLVNGRFKRVK